MITPEDVQGIADLIERKILESHENLRQEFYGSIQQLINNQQALADMLAVRQGQGEVVTALAHEFWQRAIIAESQRVQTQMDSAWEELKPQEVAEPEPEPQPARCPMCNSNNPDVAYKVRNEYRVHICDHSWHATD